MRSVRGGEVRKVRGGEVGKVMGWGEANLARAGLEGHWNFLCLDSRAWGKEGGGALWGSMSNKLTTKKF